MGVGIRRVNLAAAALASVAAMTLAFSSPSAGQQIDLRSGSALKPWRTRSPGEYVWGPRSRAARADASDRQRLDPARCALPEWGANRCDHGFDGPPRACHADWRIHHSAKAGRASLVYLRQRTHAFHAAADLAGGGAARRQSARVSRVARLRSFARGVCQAALQGDKGRHDGCHHERADDTKSSADANDHCAKCGRRGAYEQLLLGSGEGAGRAGFRAGQCRRPAGDRHSERHGDRLRAGHGRGAGHSNVGLCAAKHQMGPDNIGFASSFPRLGGSRAIPKNEWSRFHAADEFRRAVASIIQPGTTIIITSDSLADTSATPLTILDATSK